MKQNYLFILILIFGFTGCKKDSGSESVTIKYEIVSSSPFKDLNISGTVFPAITVVYVNESGQQQTEQINSTALTWSKTIQLSTTQRPIPITFYTSTYTSNTSGTGIIRIYINGTLKSFLNCSITQNISGVGSFGGQVRYDLY